MTDRKLLLAPMAGVNDPVFRALCRRMGAHLTYTEMISAKGLAYGNRKTQEMICTLPQDRPFAVQLFGSEPRVMATQARALEEQLQGNLALIDINMGCPARKVASTGSGTALLQDKALASEIVAQVNAAVQVPVTVKMRLVSQFNDADTMAFAESMAFADTMAFAESMARSGAAAVAIHGRTADQYYRTAARRDVVGLLAKHLEIPVIASGDVFSVEDIQAYWNEGASAVMVARGARGNPWIFAGRTPGFAELIAVAREHTIRLYEWEPGKLVWMRRHLAWYFKGTPCALHIRKAVQKAQTLEDYLAILEGVET